MTNNIGNNSIVKYKKVKRLILEKYEQLTQAILSNTNASSVNENRTIYRLNVLLSV